jgi:filamentous hemagglutinin family protein
MRKNHSRKTMAPRLKAMAALIPLLLVAAPVGAVQNGQVTAGNGSINTNGATTTINQQTDRLIINWNNFDIGAGEQVQFNQPSSSSAVLNRVSSASRTQIDGALNANGRVFVINPNGVVVGKTGSINANGVVLSTLDVADRDFLALGVGQYTWANFYGVTDGAVVNEGTINAGAGGVSLFGAQVVNSATGSIYAKGDDGTMGVNSRPAVINLFASDAIEVIAQGSSFAGNPAGSYSVTTFDARSAVSNKLVANDGSIRNDLGVVELGVAGGVNPADVPLRNTGSIQAKGSPTAGAGYITLYDRSSGANMGAYVAGSISADRSVLVSSDNNTTIDGTINASSIGAFASGSNRNATLLIADDAQLIAKGDPNDSNNLNLDLVGDNVVVHGQVSSNKTARVWNYNQGGASIRKGALYAPSWVINDAGTITEGSGPF